MNLVFIKRNINSWGSWAPTHEFHFLVNNRHCRRSREGGRIRSCATRWIEYTVRGADVLFWVVQNSYLLGVAFILISRRPISHLILRTMFPNAVTVHNTRIAICWITVTFFTNSGWPIQGNKIAFAYVISLNVETVYNEKAYEHNTFQYFEEIHIVLSRPYWWSVSIVCTTGGGLPHPSH